MIEHSTRPHREVATTMFLAKIKRELAHDLMPAYRIALRKLEVNDPVEWVEMQLVHGGTSEAMKELIHWLAIPVADQLASLYLDGRTSMA